MPILLAASPIEIMAKADDAGLPAAARDAAQALFHALTSAEELAAMDLPAMDLSAGAPAGGPSSGRDGGRWPVHAFLFGTEEEVAPVAAALRRQPGTLELGAGAPPGAAPESLVLCKRQDGFTGLLLACTGQDVLAGALLAAGVAA